MRQLSTRIACLLVFPILAAADIHVSTPDALKAAVTKPQPVYSAVARQMKIAGRVEIEVVVDEHGSVERAKVVKGNPLLTQSVVTAVEKWTFSPFTEGGKAVKANFMLSFDFRP